MSGEQYHSLGNAEIFKLSKTAFLCSRNYPAKAVLCVYDWAEKMKQNGQCIISGFHSRLERDVFKILIKGNQPIILAVARGLPKRYGEDIKKAIEDRRLLVLSPFPDTTKRITAATVQKRNDFMLSIADRVVVGYVKKGGILAGSLRDVSPNKEIIRLAD